MFSLKNIKKLFKYDWKTLIKKVLPNKKQLQKLLDNKK